VIPAHQQLGTDDVMTWRVVPSASNPDEAQHGGWAIIAGDIEDEPDVYAEIGAENSKQVAEFIVTAVRRHTGAMRFSGAVADIEQERIRERSKFTEVSPANRALPDALKLACLAGHLGDLAGEVTDDPHGGANRGKRLYARLACLTAGAVGWMESILSQEDDSF
jgi:hypothetical protein